MALEPNATLAFEISFVKMSSITLNNVLINIKGVVASLIDVPKFKSPYISDYNPDALELLTNCQNYVNIYMGCISLGKAFCNAV